MENEEAKAESGNGVGFGEIMTTLGKWTCTTANSALLALGHRA